MPSQFDPRIFELAHSIPARTVVERLGVPVRQQGSRGWACCPLHREKTASMVLYPDGGFKCFGCGAAGDAIDMYVALYGLDKRAAAERLCSDFGLDRPTTSSDRVAEARIKSERLERVRRESFVKDAHETLSWAWRTVRSTEPAGWDSVSMDDRIFWALLPHNALVAWLLREIETVPLSDRYEILAPYESVVTLIGQYRQFAGSAGRKTMGRHRDRYAGGRGA
jgi:hypothetical protein